MLVIPALVLSALALCHGAPSTRSVEVKNEDLLMPHVKPQRRDTYLCTPMKMSSTPTNIVGFKPQAKKEIAHHMLLYGCEEPGRYEDTWDCGEMTSSGLNHAPVCNSGSQIIYAWAMDAPDLKLPEDVAFKVGGNTKIKYLVLQVHYKNPVNAEDTSGVILETTSQTMPKRAGVLLLGTGGSIPAKSVEYMETACEIHSDLVLHPFAFRTHAHKLGQVVSGYRIRNKEWTELGRKSPQLPQMFYNVTNPGLDVKNGDIVAARCTMKNDLDHVVNVGATQDDEMCNFYMMYYVDGDRVYDQKYCFSGGPPYYTWKKAPEGRKMATSNMPKDISVIPGTSKVLEKGKKTPVLRDEAWVDEILRGMPETQNNNLDVDRLLKAVNYAYDPEYKLYDNEF